LKFLLGPDLNSCLKALESSDTKQSLHIVERINIELLVQNSILPSRAKLPSVIRVPRVKVSGRLPTLQVNVSDNKYKAMMRFVDTAIPKFGDVSATSEVKKPAQSQAIRPPGFRLPSGLFGSDPKPEYGVEDNGDDDEHEQFVDAEDSAVEVRAEVCWGCFPSNSHTLSQANQRQQTFDLDFRVDTLQALVSKSNTQGIEKPLGDLRLQGFRLGCAVEDLKITVSVTLRYIYIAYQVHTAR
jgi:vacuolar protein sorting-associated protein 13A/C